MFTVGCSGKCNISKGSIQINGKEIVGLKEKELSEVRRKNIGIVFQSFYFFQSFEGVKPASPGSEKKIPEIFSFQTLY